MKERGQKTKNREKKNIFPGLLDRIVNISRVDDSAIWEGCVNEAKQKAEIKCTQLLSHLESQTEEDKAIAFQRELDTCRTKQQIYWWQQNIPTQHKPSESEAATGVDTAEMKYRAYMQGYKFVLNGQEPYGNFFKEPHGNFFFDKDPFGVQRGDYFIEGAICYLYEKFLLKSMNEYPAPLKKGKHDQIEGLSIAYFHFYLQNAGIETPFDNQGRKLKEIWKDLAQRHGRHWKTIERGWSEMKGLTEESSLRTKPSRMKYIIQAIKEINKNSIYRPALKLAEADLRMAQGKIKL